MICGTNKGLLYPFGAHHDQIQIATLLSAGIAHPARVNIIGTLFERYVWDEPLNYIDTYSRIQIENLIKTFLPTMIFVEHDRTFRRWKIPSYLLQIESA